MVTTILPRVYSSRLRRDPIFFQPERIALSRGAYAALALAGCSPRWLVRRHIRGDWGFFRGEDARDNAWALTHAAPVRSVFELPTGARLLLLTEDTRALTSILLAEVDPVAAAVWMLHDFAHDVSPAVAQPIAPRATQPTPAAAANGPHPTPIHHGPASLADLLPRATLADFVR